MTARLAVVVGVLAVLSAWAHARPLAVAPPAVDFSTALPLVFDEWIGRDAPPLDPAVAKTLGATQYVHRYYGLRVPRTADGGVRVADGGKRIADDGVRSADGGVRSADGGARSADDGVRSADGGARTADDGVRIADGGMRIADGGVRIADGGARTADDGVRIADGGMRIADGGVRIADVEADIAYYARPQAGASMHSPLNCLPGNGWRVVDARAQPLAAGGETVPVRRLVVARGGDRIAMIYWFLNRSGVVGDEYRQRLELFRNGLSRRPADAALVRVMALDTPDGRASLERFSAATLPLLTAAFR